MTKADAETALEAVMDGIDEQIAAALEGVTVYVVEGREDPELRAAIKNAGMERAIVRPDFRGLYLGTTARPLEDQDGPYDMATPIGSPDDPFLVTAQPLERGGLPEIPRGSIVLNCLALKDLEDLRDTLAHEMGHALGMSEEEVENLGLG